MRAARYMARKFPSDYLSYDDKVQAGWDGIIKAWCAGEEGPLWQFARRGIADATRAYQQNHQTGDGRTGQQFAVYWRSVEDPHNFADDLVETIAVQQIMGGLKPAFSEVLNVFASTRSVAGTASTLGITYKAAHQRITSARTAAKEMWFAPDPAPRGQWRRTVSGTEVPYREFLYNRRGHERYKAKAT